MIRRTQSLRQLYRWWLEQRGSTDNFYSFFTAYLAVAQKRFGASRAQACIVAMMEESDDISQVVGPLYLSAFRGNPGDPFSKIREFNRAIRWTPETRLRAVRILILREEVARVGQPEGPDEFTKRGIRP